MGGWAQVPSKEQVSSVTEELQQRSTLPDHLKKVLSSLPKDTHPMTQLSIAILALQVSHGALTMAAYLHD